MICGSGGSKSRLAKATGAEPCGQMRDEKLHAAVARSTFSSQKCKKTNGFRIFFEVAMSKKCTLLWREAHFQVKSVKNWRFRSTFGRLDVEKVYAVVARSTFPSQKCKKLTGSEHFWTFKCRFAWQAQGIVHLVKIQKWAKREDFIACPKTMAGVGHMQRICKDAFSVAGAVQETSSSELLGGPGADLLREVTFWSIRSDLQVCWDDFAWHVQHFVWPGITFSWRAQYFRQVELKNSKTHWYEAVSSALNFPFLKDVSQNCFVFDAVNVENWGSLAELFRSWCCQVQKLMVSQNCFVFDVVKFKNWGSLAELFRFWRCQVQQLRKSRRIAPFSSLKIDI